MANMHKMLFGAAERGDLAPVRELLDDGAYPNWRNPDRDRGHTEVVRLLLERGGDPNISDRDGYTPLHLAAMYPKVPILALLLANGADVNARTNYGYTPLMKSTLWGRLSAPLLLDHGANPWLADNEGRTALSECERRRRGDYAGTRAALKHAMNVTWQNNSPPTLEELAAFQLRRMRSQIDEEEFVDTIPDALVWFYFREWEGAEKWTGLWRGDDE